IAVALPIRRARRRNGRHESLLRPSAVERRLEIVDVGLELRHAAIGDGRGADHVSLARGYVPLAVELRKGLRFARARPRALPRHLPVHLEAAETFVDVRYEAWLAEFAIVDDVDAEVDLLAHDLGHRLAQPRGVGLRVDGLALFLGPHHGEQIGGPRQASDVGGENPVDAALHGPSRLLPSSPRKRGPIFQRRGFLGPPRAGAAGYKTNPHPVLYQLPH